MSLLFGLFCLPVLIGFTFQGSQTTANPKLLSQIKRFEVAYVNRRLQTFENPAKGKIKVTIEHSLAEPPEGVQPRQFDSFKQIETWLRSKEHGAAASGEDRLPFREVRGRVFVSKGLFEYENQGIAHNHLYLSRVRFSQKGDNLSIIEIVLEDGD